MPETRYVETVMPDGSIALENPTEVSDEELYQEQLDQEFNEVHVDLINKLNRWGQLNNNQKDTLLKFLIRKDLYRDGYLKLGIL